MHYSSGRFMFYMSEQIPTHHVILLITSESVIVSVFLINCLTDIFFKQGVLISFQNLCLILLQKDHAIKYICSNQTIFDTFYGKFWNEGLCEIYKTLRGVPTVII